ncbi:MAG: hypothetical protein ACYCOU_07445 [Sulfobacillus sp.]
MNTREFLAKTDKDIAVMVANDLHYLSFFVMRDVITLMGMMCTWNGIDTDISDGGMRHFNLALRTFPSLNKYSGLIDGPYDLYRGLESPLKVGKGIVVTQASDPENGNDHMVVLSFGGTRRMVFVCEDLHADISEAIRSIGPGDSVKWTADPVPGNPNEFTLRHELVDTEFMDPDLKADDCYDVAESDAGTGSDGCTDGNGSGGQ